MNEKKLCPGCPDCSSVCQICGKDNEGDLMFTAEKWRCWNCRSEYYINRKAEKLSGVSIPYNAAYFIVEDCVFIGNLSEAKRRYVKANPSKQWFIWLCDNYREIKDIKIDYPYICVYKTEGQSFSFIPTMIDYMNKQVYRQIGQTSDSGEWFAFDEVEFIQIKQFNITEANNE